jgi:hypothetical protein
MPESVRYGVIPDANPSDTRAHGGAVMRASPPASTVGSVCCYGVSLIGIASEMVPVKYLAARYGTLG